MPSPRLIGAAVSLVALLGSLQIQGGSFTYNFSTDPSQGANPVTIGGNNPDYYVDAGGNPGGFLAITYPIGSQKTTVVFPNTDPGKIVTGFELSCDLRVGNPTGARAADGFSISFARDGDPILDDANSDAFGGNCCAETGTKTGIAISFDTWSGNTFPNDPNDKTDIEGFIIRVDDVTVRKVSLPTRNGLADDNTSLQTGPRAADYWTAGGDPKDPGSWAGLAWKPFSVKLTPDGKLTVKWKDRTILDNFQTSYFPSSGRLVLSGRTGGANEHTHVDNLVLTTTAADVTGIPGPVSNLAAPEKGSRRIKLTWTAATVPGDPVARIAYEVERNGVVIAPLVTGTSYEDRGAAPGTSYTYKVRGKNIAGKAGPDATVTAATVQDVAGTGFLKAEQWTGIGGTGIDGGISDAHFSDPPDRVRFVNGLSFGETSGFGDTWGDNHIVKISGVFKAPESGNFRFFIRSDDGGNFYFNTAGEAVPDVTSATPVAIETGCCTGFLEPPDEQVSEPIALVEGRSYGFALLVKEGGGGDWGQVAIRKEGDPTPASALTPLRGGVLTGQVDGVGATVTITTPPAAQTVVANSPVTFTAVATGSSPYGGDYGNAVVYQWYIGGKAILGATGASYTRTVTPIEWNGLDVTVGAGVAGAWATSAPAKLTVNVDTVPPTVKRVNGSDTFNSVTVIFSEPVTDSALTVANYTITGLTLSAPARVNERTVRFTTSAQAINTVYPVRITGVRDNANLAVDFTGTFTSFQLVSGAVFFGMWTGETGGFNTWVDVPVSAKPPSSVATKTSFWSQIGNTATENYFGQLKAIFTPATSGNYVFFMSADDHSELYLSTDENPANKKRIAEEPAWGGERGWQGGADGTASNGGTRGALGEKSNRSDEYANTEWSTGAGGNISLVAGKKYYLELLYKEGGGGDHGAATFLIKTGATAPATPADGTASALTGNLVAWYIDPGLQPPTVATAPTGVSYASGETISFSVVANSALPATYQWYQNKKAIAGATSATLTIPNAGAANVGDYYVRVTNENGSFETSDNDARATMTGAFVIEAEDYNFGSGQTVAAASVSPLVSDLYKGKDGVYDVDFHGIESTADSGANGNSYRNGWVDAGSVQAAAPNGNIDVIIDNGGGGPGEQNRKRPDFVLTNNYKIGWGNQGDWYNYTRDFPPGNYSAVIGYSRDGRTADAYGVALELVTGDRTKPGQVATLVGEATLSGTGGWSSDDRVPLLAPGSQNVASFALGANTTVRLRIAKGDPDLDYLLFYRAGAGAPQFSSIVLNANGSITLTWTGGGRLQSTGALGTTWTDVPGAASPFTFTPTARQLFGRLVAP